MTSYRERQEETDRFYEGEELLLTFRGQGKRVLEAARRHAHDHWRVQKALSDSTVYSALRGDLAWSPVVEVLTDLAVDVQDNPRPYCEPPEIPDDWDDMRKVFADYATSDWWFDALGIDDLCKAATWRSYLSRRDMPKWAEDVRSRARDWRVRVMQGLRRWEVGVKERLFWADMIDFRVKDALDTGGEAAAFEAFCHLKQHDQGTSRWPTIRESFYFDPANPDGPQYTFAPKDEDALRREFIDLLASGFPRYRSSSPEPDVVTVIQELRGFATDDLRNEWQAPAEVELRLTWDQDTRGTIASRRVVRVRVKAAPRHAQPGERLEQERRRVRRKNGEWEEEVDHFVWRWRAFDPDIDTLGDAEGREKAMRLAGLNYPDDDPNAYLLPMRQPIEDRGGYSIE